jgi:hypothetical protein
MRPRWVLPVVLVVVIITAAAGLVARAVYTRPASEAAAIPPNQIPPAEEPGPATVTATTDAAAHPLYETMRALLQTYFDSINGRHYDQWRTVVSTRRARLQPQKDWEVAYQSTKDGTIIMHRIESGPPNTARILLSFTSVQDPHDAPPELPEPCIRWKVVFPVAFEDNTWKLDSGPTSSAPQHEKC